MAQLKSFYGLDEVDAGRQGCCTFLLYRCAAGSDAQAELDYLGRGPVHPRPG